MVRLLGLVVELEVVKEEQASDLSRDKDSNRVESLLGQRDARNRRCSGRIQSRLL